MKNGLHQPVVMLNVANIIVVLNPISDNNTSGDI